MTAVPIYVWNGSAWQETGPTIPASPIAYQASAPSSPATGDIWVDSDGDVTTGSQQFQRFRFVASGGETTISGVDANGAVLAYTAGLEQVVLNGAVLVRGHDYTATNGTSITGLSPALVANDVVEVFSFMAFNVANTYTQSQVDGFISSLGGTDTAWVSYTPTFSSGSWAVGNGTFNAKYKQIGKTVVVKGLFTFGSTTVKDASTGLQMSLPVTGVDNINQPALATYLDSGTANYLGIASLSTTTIAFQETTVSGSKIVYAGVTTNAPFTWATNDQIRFTAIYEAA